MFETTDLQDHLHQSQPCHGPPDHIDTTFLNQAYAVLLLPADISRGWTQDGGKVRKNPSLLPCALIIQSLKLISQNLISQTYRISR